MMTYCIFFLSNIMLCIEEDNRIIVSGLNVEEKNFIKNQVMNSIKYKRKYESRLLANLRRLINKAILPYIQKELEEEWD